jgi:hypothetical protein
MVAPMVLAAGIGAAGSALGGIAGGKGAKKAAKVAAKSQEKITSMNNALIQGMYNQNAARIDPFVQGGTRAGNVLMELLLGNYGAAPGSPGTVGSGAGGYNGGASSNSLASDWARIHGYLTDDIKQNFDPAAEAFIQANLSRLPAGYSGPSWQDIQAYKTDDIKGNYEAALAQLGGVIAAAPPPVQAQAPAAGAGAATGTAATPNALSAWDAFRNGTNYQWRLGQGTEATQQGFAGQSTDSGAEKLALLEYGQNFASNELGNWMNMLAGQQSLGANAANALAGVGTNATSQMINSNQMLADARGNQALINGQANQNMWGSIGQGIGQIAGAWGSSYNTPQYGQPSPIVTNYNNPAWGGGGMWG